MGSGQLLLPPAGSAEGFPGSGNEMPSARVGTTPGGHVCVLQCPVPTYWPECEAWPILPGEPHLSLFAEYRNPGEIFIILNSPTAPGPPPQPGQLWRGRAPYAELPTGPGAAAVKDTCRRGQANPDLAPAPRPEPTCLACVHLPGPGASSCSREVLSPRRPQRPHCPDALC